MRMSNNKGQMWAEMALRRPLFLPFKQLGLATYKKECRDLGRFMGLVVVGLHLQRFLIIDLDRVFS